MKILIDNGHGAETPGKCSPDGRLREYAEVGKQCVTGDIMVARIINYL